MTSLLNCSGTRLARMIRNREVSSRDVVQAHIEQINMVNPSIRAVVQDRFDQALQEADQADRRLTQEPPEGLPPFHGVPCTIKECFSLQGMPNTSGLVARKGFHGTEDATTVSRLRQAGAIPLGVTNVPELCMWIETNNKVYGRTKNPYNLKRIVGGSSGGEGAIIAAGGSPFGLGSDTGGSIRLPAFFNGVFGHKPTSGLIPNTGQHPIAENEGLRYLTTGPLARQAEDLISLLRVMAGPDGLDPACKPGEIGNPAQVLVEDLSVYMVEPPGLANVQGDLLGARKKAAEFLARKGATVKEVRADRLRHSMEIWSCMMNAAKETSFGELLGNGTPVSSFQELARWIFGCSSHTLPAIVLAILEKIPLDQRKFIASGKKLRRELAALMGSRGIILYPPYPSTAPHHNKPMFPPLYWSLAAIFNVLEFPVTQVPLGLNRKGLPLGVQVVGPFGCDHVTIAVAQQLEEEFGGWVPPRDFNTGHSG